MDPARIRASIHAAARLSFSRSGGPGGQNVNKVNTKVEARVPLEELDGLSQAELDRARTVLANRILDGGVLQVVAEEERSQAANRERALSRMEALIISAARIPKRRISTKPTKGSVERRILEKKLTSRRKHNRRISPGD